MKYLETFINALAINIHNNEIPDKLDIVLEGGAINGSIHIGALCYLKELEKMNKTKIMRISGVSCGALIGSLFLLIDLETIEKYYLKMADCLVSFGNFSCLEKYLDEMLEKVEDDKIKALTDRLFISYTDLKTQERVVVSEFKTKDDLKNALFKSAFLPGLINGSIMTEDRCIDGGLPYIFPNSLLRRKTPEYKTLYLRLLSLDTFVNSISVRGEINGSRRAVEGIQHVHDLFKLKKPNKYASIAEDWTKLNIIQYFAINFIWWSISYLTILLDWFYTEILPNKIKEHTLTIRFKCLISNLWVDYISRLLN